MATWATAAAHRGRRGRRSPRSAAPPPASPPGPRSPSSPASSASNASSKLTATGTVDRRSARIAERPVATDTDATDARCRRRTCRANPPFGERVPRGAGGQADLALLVDLLDDDLDLLTEGEHVFDVVDPLALAELGDVHETVATGEDVDERTELGDVDDPAHVGRADVGLRRVDDRQDASLGFLHLRGLDCADRDDADRSRRRRRRCRHRSLAGWC